MAALKEIISLIEEIAPLRLAESWDNSGLQLGDPDKEIKKIKIALDPDEDAIQKASQDNTDLLITHHPLFFSDIKSLNYQNNFGKIVKTAVCSDLAVYSAHTSLDSASGGLNDFIAEKAGIVPLFPILPGDDGLAMEGPGRICENSEKLDGAGLINKLKKILNIDYITVAGDLNVYSDKIGVCTGSGASLISKSRSMGAEIFITGDVKYHEAKDAADQGMCIIDAGHYNTEIIACDLIKNRLDHKIKKSGLEIETEVFLNKEVFKII
ncbi:MAG: Nif3-like dinuclear metal center hexameric protein [Thermodesulfobacteriota bacterium]